MGDTFPYENLFTVAITVWSSYKPDTVSKAHAVCHGLVRMCDLVQIIYEALSGLLKVQTFFPFYLCGIRSFVRGFLTTFYQLQGL